MTLAADTAQVYRLYDADGRLLYVGCSGSVEQRVRTHITSQPWGTQIARHEVDEPLPVKEALAREKQAIAAELPLYNVAAHPNPLPKKERPPDWALLYVMGTTVANRTMIWHAFWRGDLPVEPTPDDVRKWISTLDLKFHRCPCPFAPDCSCERERLANEAAAQGIWAPPAQVQPA